jgi:hypothetical protein
MEEKRKLTFWKVFMALLAVEKAHSTADESERTLPTTEITINRAIEIGKLFLFYFTKKITLYKYIYPVDVESESLL